MAFNLHSWQPHQDAGGANEFLKNPVLGGQKCICDFSGGGQLFSGGANEILRFPFGGALDPATNYDLFHRLALSLEKYTKKQILLFWRCSTVQGPGPRHQVAKCSSVNFLIRNWLLETRVQNLCGIDSFVLCCYFRQQSRILYPSRGGVYFNKNKHLDY